MKRSIAAALLCSISAPAVAQETLTFDGFYLGAVGGYDDVTLEAGGLEGSSDGAVFGAVGGYDFSVGSMLFGAEVELTESTAGYTEYDVLDADDSVSLDAGLDFYIGARAGLVASNTVLIYGKVGFTSASVEGTYNDGAGFSDSEGENMGGYRVGGGIEFAATSSLRLRAEYRYSDYGEFKYNDGVDVYPTGIDASRSQIMAGLLLGF
ncbi:outer membrane protein [Qipengyuania zhejiangensis]|uniref:outer membrane protein n=1 Tax=Qipengyuania zhejiangensis TaxID=3077782 RepID=UPI002D794FBA|nr:outer membrane beta-barrel protein [Qipengyuania sp. Z2]